MVVRAISELKKIKILDGPGNVIATKPRMMVGGRKQREERIPWIIADFIRNLHLNSRIVAFISI